MVSDYDNDSDKPSGRSGGNTALIVLGVLAGVVVVCGGIIVVCIAAVVTLGQNASGTFSFVGSKVSSAGAAGPPPVVGTTGGVDVGQTALEIEGDDLDGQRFKLSDYRGKVVLLDFWGNW